VDEEAEAERRAEAEKRAAPPLAGVSRFVKASTDGTSLFEPRHQ